MVATVKKIGAGAADYYTAMEADAKLDDYYSAEGCGKWHGSGKHAEGSQVTREDFESYIKGIDPKTGDPVFKGAERDNRMSGVDLQFAPDKSVSALFATTKDRVLQEKIEEAHNNAVADALNFIQEEGMQDQNGNKIDCPIAGFTHYTSREGDPQLHNHNVILNAGEAGLDTRSVFKARTSANAIYQAQLSHNLRSLGYNLTQDESGRSFKVDGISEELCEVWSKRKNQVEQHVKEYLNDETAETKDNIAVAKQSALDTRKKKDELGLTKEELMQRQLDEADGFTSDHLKTKEQRADFTKAEKIEDDAPRDFKGKTMVKAVNSKFDIYKISAEVLLEQGKPATLKHINSLIDEEVALRNLVKFSDGNYAHSDMIKLEKSMIQLSDKVANRTHAVDPSEVFRKFPTMTTEQRTAVQHACEGKGLANVEGAAGAGKSFCVNAIREAHELAGYKTVGIAISYKAADVMKAEGKLDNTTSVAKFLSEVKNGKRSLDKDTVLIIDEAGLVDAKSAEAVLAHVEKTGAKIILTGDSEQLQSIGAANSFSALIERHGTARIDEIRRQKSDDYRSIVYSIKEGKKDEFLRDKTVDLKDANGQVILDPNGNAQTCTQQNTEAKHNFIKELKNQNLLQWRENREDTLTAIVDEWEKDPEQIVMAVKNADVRFLNDSIRNKLIDSGALKGEQHTIYCSDAGVEQESNFCDGDKIRFTSKLNINGFELTNGTTAVINSIKNNKTVDSDGKEIDNLSLDVTVDLPDGSTKDISFTKEQIDKEGVAQIRTNYAITVFASQGQTVDKGLLYGEGLDRRTAYVGMSRTREQTQLFVPKVDLMHKVRDSLNPNEAGRQILQPELEKQLLKDMSTITSKSTTLQYQKIPKKDNDLFATRKFKASFKAMTDNAKNKIKTSVKSLNNNKSTPAKQAPVAQKVKAAESELEM